MNDEALKDDVIFRRKLLDRLDALVKEIKESRKFITAKIEAVKSK